jgi:hypothetical protein
VALEYMCVHEFTLMCKRALRILAYQNATHSKRICPHTSGTMKVPNACQQHDPTPIWCHAQALHDLYSTNNRLYKLHRIHPMLRHPV